jgi:hypothetical protein
MSYDFLLAAMLNQNPVHTKSTGPHSTQRRAIIGRFKTPSLLSSTATDCGMDGRGVIVRVLLE